MLSRISAVQPHCTKQQFSSDINVAIANYDFVVPVPSLNYLSVFLVSSSQYPCCSFLNYAYGDKAMLYEILS
jgi:hypothetical protein